MADPDYMIEYEKFQNDFKLAETSGEEIGKVIMRMAGHFARYNMAMGEALRNFSTVKAVFQNATDPATGKTTSSAKAELLADDTDEGYKYEMSRIHIQNIEQYINALKALQKGSLNEYSHAA